MGAGLPDLDRPGTRLGDFTNDRRNLLLVPLAVAIGGLAAGAALGLLDLIGLATHLAYYGNVGSGLVDPGGNHLGAWALLIPVAGGLAVGLMARFGSEQIRGHGIPEAMETILVRGSRVQPRLAVLKPISSAVSIGSGGPFGAEGPIILTGGALGSIVAQLFHLAAIERRTLLVAGACAGMAAVFGTPVAAALFGVELLLFEWRPRSFVPVAAAVVVAAMIRERFAAAHLLGAAPLFPLPVHAPLDLTGVGQAAGIGVVMGVLALVLTTFCYGAEDAFKRLPIHWMWWPALGGLVVGIGGLVDGRALGVGYPVIAAELAGRLTVGALLLLLVVKLVMWSVALGSGTSGGILAPLLMMGAAAGAVVGQAFGGGTATWALLGMAGALAGVTRSPLTSIVFAFELTGDGTMLLPLLATCTIAHLVSTLVLRRSILTEKVARRGYHVMREYAVDHLEAVFVREAMLTDVVTVDPDDTAADLRTAIESDAELRRQRLYPVLGPDGFQGVVGWSDLLACRDAPRTPVAEVAHRGPVVAWPDETLRTAADRMAAHTLGALPVVDRADPRRLVGVLTQFELLAGRRRRLYEERHRERHLRVLRRSTPAGAGGGA